MARFDELMPFVKKFGVSDDVDRGLVISASSDTELSALIEVFNKYSDELDDYLISPEVDSMHPNYIALTACRMAADEAEASRNTVSDELRKQRTDEIMKSIFGPKT